jgi:hypothetical protein
MGLLLARVSLEEAVNARSRELFSRFLFRFAAHLKASISMPGLSGSERLSLAIAAEKAFESLPTASEAQRVEAASVRARLSGVTPTDSDWRATLGVSKLDFFAIIEKFERELGGARRVRSRALQRTSGRSSIARQSSEPIRDHPLPSWLSFDLQPSPDPLVSSSANWQPTNYVGSTKADVADAWSAFSEGEYRVARDHVSGLLAQLGSQWGPTSSAVSLRSWNWLRLVVELAALEAGETSDARRSWASVCALHHKCLPDQTERLEAFVANAIGGMIGNDIASRRALNAYSTRLVSELGHEVALAVFTNAEKGTLRTTWAEQFKLDADDVRSTVMAVSTITSLMRQATQRLYVGARDGSSPSRVLRDASHSLVEFLDEAEGDLFNDALSAAADSERTIKAAGTNHQDLSDLLKSLRNTRSSIAISGSALLQDFVAPVVEIAMSKVGDAVTQLGDISRPELSLQLTNSKIAFSAAEGSTVRLSFRATNSGNAAAEAIVLRVVQDELMIDSTSRLELLGSGAQAEIIVTATATGASPRAVVLTCHLEWTDSLLQTFKATQELSAEDQMPVAWTASDVNPFSLGTISEPERLVGRLDDLSSLDALIAGGASAYITGHKRVGKTSLTRVLLRSLAEERGWAGSLLPLGRALGQEQEAGDLVYALLDEILDSARSAYPEAMKEVEDVGADDSGNFARAANRWLRVAARALPSDARVVIAIDDFDELPPHLISGPQADALFLFLRSLVDEPWLNIMVVGSEILPSIIQAQAHKLNQVVPVSVTNFASRNSTAELLESPTKRRLEWLPEAIDRVHYLCSGNPYYETLLAQRIWLTMRERSRSVVTAGDVEDAAAAVAREAPGSHFIHLWADSVSGLAHTSRMAIVASAVLRSVARAGGDSLVPAAIDEVTRIAQGWVQTATNEEVAQMIASLTAREIVKPGPSSRSLLLTIPLVGTWLRAAGGKALDGIYANSKHATATSRMVADVDLVSIAQKLRYQGEHVSEIRIRAWLDQFGDHYRQYLAYKMLRRMATDGYFTSTRLQNVELPRLATAVGELGAARLLIREDNQYLRNALLIDHGVPGDSTQGTISALAKSLRIKKANILPIDRLADRVRNSSSGIVLFLLDDFSGSGTHLRGELTRLLETMNALGEEWADKIHVVVGASVVSDIADLPTSAGPIVVETIGATFLGERYRPFSPDSGVFDTPKEREDAEDMATSIGRALMPNNPLGYGGRALLTLFEFNCPNNAAPIFWRAGTVAGEKWAPLFERSV